MPESLYGAHPKKLPVRFKLPSHLDLLRFQHAKVKVGSVVYSIYMFWFQSTMLEPWEHDIIAILNLLDFHNR